MENNAVLWTSDEISSYTNGNVKTPFSATGISIDTRTLQKGDLYIALKGDNNDGHVYTSEAFENGASGVIISDTKSVQLNDPAVCVSDTNIALYDLARGARERAKNLESIAITGSVGKTGTKEMLAHVLRHFGNTHATQGNLNNHFGLPLTLARMSQNTQFGVFEMGMNHAGEITPLSQLAKPKISIITWIAPAHIEFFDGIEGIAKAKAEIFEGMSAGSVAILPFDNSQFSILLAEARTKGISTILSFGTNKNADAYIISTKETDNGNHITASIMGEKITFLLPQIGAHHAINAISVLLCVRALEQDLNQAAKVLADFKPVVGRGNIISLPFNSKKIRIIDETYNASPEAMKAAITVLGTIKNEKNGRRIAILGDMLELGSQSDKLHESLAEIIMKQPIDLVLCCGQFMQSLAGALPSNKVFHFKDSKALSNKIEKLIQPNDLLMIKGSHGSQMGIIIDEIKKICS